MVNCCIMNTFLMVFVGLLAAANALSFFDVVREDWKAFKLEFSKQYDSDTEDRLRMKIFMENNNKIAKHNQLFHKGHVTYKMGLNQYSDWTHQEYVTHLNEFNFNTTSKLFRGRNKPAEEPVFYVNPAKVELQDSFDWRDQGAVTEVKNQGQCGSCWSFSATGAIEGQYFRKTGSLVSLSEQNLLDCSGPYGTHGCNGGWMDHAFQYIIDNGGIDTEESYPYEAAVGSCRYNPENSCATVRGFTDIPKGDENQLLTAIATVGPISITMDASHDSFRHYASGLYYEPQCDSQKLTHAMLAVGYGADENGNAYYIVKNSWATTWGEKGYIKMARNQNNNCGIATAATFPLV